MFILYNSDAYIDEQLIVLSEKRGISVDILKKYHVLKFKDEEHLKKFVESNNNYKDLLEFKDDKSIYTGYLIVDFINKKGTQVIMLVNYNLNSVAKYVNHSSHKYNPYFKNSKVLGLDKIDYKRNHIIVVEGVFDYIHLSSYGYNVISLLGSKIGEYHTLLLDRFKNVYLCFDVDDSGKKSVKDAIKLYEKFNVINIKGISEKYLEEVNIKDIDDLLIRLEAKYSKNEIVSILNQYVK